MIYYCLLLFTLLASLSLAQDPPKFRISMAEELYKFNTVTQCSEGKVPGKPMNGFCVDKPANLPKMELNSADDFLLCTKCDDTAYLAKKDTRLVGRCLKSIVNNGKLNVPQVRSFYEDCVTCPTSTQIPRTENANTITCIDTPPGTNDICIMLRVSGQTINCIGKVQVGNLTTLESIPLPANCTSYVFQPKKVAFKCAV